MAIRITCINRSNRYSNQEEISYLGWTEDYTNRQGKYTPSEMYDWIEKGLDAYVLIKGQRVRVIGAKRNDTKYVKTEADTTTSNNLLSLMECIY